MIRAKEGGGSYASDDRKELKLINFESIRLMAA